MNTVHFYCYIILLGMYLYDAQLGWLMLLFFDFNCIFKEVTKERKNGAALLLKSQFCFGVDLITTNVTRFGKTCHITIFTKS